MEGTDPMKWNLRLVAANCGIWKASELQRMLAERGMVISAGKMSGLWSGHPNTIKLDELDIICAVLGCGVEELLLPEPQTVPKANPATGEQPAAIGRPVPSPRAPAPAGPCRPDDLHALRRTHPRRWPAGSGLLQQQLPAARPVRPA
jgi:DNA-binding Xre family transcriptional regulator